MIRDLRIAAAFVAAAFFVPPALAQMPPADPAAELGLAQQQLANLHRLYDELERKAALTVQNDQNLQKQLADQKQEIQRWQQYYASCKPGDRWLCDEPPVEPPTK